MPKILIVDDDDHTARLLRDMFGGHGLSATVCADGEAALDRVQVEQPDLVLLDVNVPGPDGFEICRLIREHEHEDRHTTIVVITRRDDAASKLLAFSVGADDYVVKPLDEREMRSRVTRWLDRRAHHAGIVLRRRRDAIREMVTALCHELNNPLQAAVLGVDMARQHLDDGHPSDANLRVVGDHLARIHEIIVHLQDVDDRTVPYVGQERMIDIGLAKRGK
jgi:DNA-binding response OmpR family regulator